MVSLVIELTCAVSVLLTTQTHLAEWWEPVDDDDDWFFTVTFVHMVG